MLSFHKVFIALGAVFLTAAPYLFSRSGTRLSPATLNAIVSPAHGKVDVIEETVESEFMKGAFESISIRVSLPNVQMQYAPAAGTVAHCAHRPAHEQSGAAESEIRVMEVARGQSVVTKSE